MQTPEAHAQALQLEAADPEEELDLGLKICCAPQLSRHQEGSSFLHASAHHIQLGKPSTSDNTKLHELSSACMEMVECMLIALFEAECCLSFAGMSIHQLHHIEN